MFFRKNRNEDLRLHGWAKFFHRIGRFLLLPFRHPLITLLILFVLFMAPTFRGVKPVNVCEWYASQVSAVYNKVLVWWGIREPSVAPGTFVFKPKADNIAPAVIMQDAKVTTSKTPNVVDVLKQQNTDTEGNVAIADETSKKTTTEPEEAKPEVKNDIRLPEDEKIYAYPKDKKVYSLKYLDYPHEIVGKAKVYDCNEIEINDEFIMLYGIYVHPYTSQGVSATEYLKKLIDNKEVKCGVVAYTEQGIATGICYYNNENINRGMVIKGYTKNVAL